MYHHEHVYTSQHRPKQDPQRCTQTSGRKSSLLGTYALTTGTMRCSPNTRWSNKSKRWCHPCETGIQTPPNKKVAILPFCHPLLLTIPPFLAIWPRVPISLTGHYQLEQTFLFCGSTFKSNLPTAFLQGKNWTGYGVTNSDAYRQRKTFMGVLYVQCISTCLTYISSFIYSHPHPALKEEGRC